MAQVEPGSKVIPSYTVDDDGTVRDADTGAEVKHVLVSGPVRKPVSSGDAVALIQGWRDWRFSRDRS